VGSISAVSQKLPEIVCHRQARLKGGQLSAVSRQLSAATSFQRAVIVGFGFRPSVVVGSALMREWWESREE
jgi:hypothetical protein